jgi:hypothetical protein
MKWFVILVLIATKPTTDGKEPSYEPGDVIKAFVMGPGVGASLADQETNCHKGGALLRDRLQEVGQDSVKAVYTCALLPASIEEFQTKKDARQ